jgi:adenosine deaminase
MGFSDDVLREITRTAIDAAFCDDELKAALHERV